jgi:hypothetical protein
MNEAKTFQISMPGWTRANWVLMWLIVALLSASLVFWLFEMLDYFAHRDSDWRELWLVIVVPVIYYLPARDPLSVLHLSADVEVTADGRTTIRYLRGRAWGDASTVTFDEPLEMGAWKVSWLSRLHAPDGRPVAWFMRNRPVAKEAVARGLVVW